MLRIALAQIEVIPGRPDLNTKTMLSMIEQGREQQAQLIIFPEMSIPGYLLGDTWEQQAFLRDCEEYGRQIVAASAGLVVIFGNVAMDWDKNGDDGRVRKYNACFVAQDGRLVVDDNFPYPFRIKTLQPNYREFDDDRHFCSLRKLAQELNIGLPELLQPLNLEIDGRRLRLGCILCEDGWSDDYPVKPIAMLHANGPVDLIVNISSSPFTLGKNNKRNRVFSQQARETGIPLVYVNNVGLQNNGKTVYTFDGFSTVYDGNGQTVAFCAPFKPALKVIDLDPDRRGDGGAVWEDHRVQNAASDAEMFHQHTFEQSPHVHRRGGVAGLEQLGGLQGRPIAYDALPLQGSAQDQGSGRRAVVRAVGAVDVGGAAELGCSHHDGVFPLRAQAVGQPVQQIVQIGEASSQQTARRSLVGVSVEVVHRDGNDLWSVLGGHELGHGDADGPHGLGIAAKVGRCGFHCGGVHRVHGVGGHFRLLLRHPQARCRLGHGLGLKSAGQGGPQKGIVGIKVGQDHGQTRIATSQSAGRPGRSMHRSTQDQRRFHAHRQGLQFARRRQGLQRAIQQPEGVP